MARDLETLSLMRIFVDESDRRDGKPLYMSLVDELQKLGCAGATVFKGIEGFGSHRELHAARAFDFSNNMPVLIEVIDTAGKIDDTASHLRETIGEGLITIERVQTSPVEIEHE